MLSKDQHEDGREYDALRVLAREMTRSERDKWPEALFLLGDQVYVDEGSPRTRERIHQRRGTETPPGDEVTDYEEYSWLYEESWSDPLIRWLLSTVSTSMQWDDHDMSDDWNISRSWLEEMRRKSWWHRRVVAGIMSYWVHQHIGNLSPRALDEDDLYPRVRGNDHATAVLREFAAHAHTTGAGVRWSYCRDLGRSRAIFIDSRAGRVLEDGQARDRRRGGVGLDRRACQRRLRPPADRHHRPLSCSRPASTTSRPGTSGSATGPGEDWPRRQRRSCAAPSTSTTGRRSRTSRSSDCAVCSKRSGPGSGGGPPASIVVLSGDVHHAYLAETAFDPEAGVESSVYQAVCSPYRNPLDERERRAIRTGFSRPFIAAMRALGRSAGAPDPGMRWRLAEGPYFDNQVATIRLDGREARMQLDKTIGGEEDQRHLECVFERRIA